MQLSNGLSGPGMESQLTLVDTSTFGTPHTVLSFVRDDMKNTRIVSTDEQILYSVDTDKTSNTHTIVRRRDTAEIVAEVKRRELRPDTVKFDTDQKRKLSSWLSGVNGKWSDFPVSFDWQGSKYTWKSNKARQIALYEESDSLNPLAWFQTSKKDTVNGNPTIFRALLALQPDGFEILDAIIVSLLVVEYNLRMKETKYHNGDGRATFMVYF